MIKIVDTSFINKINIIVMLFNTCNNKCDFCFQTPYHAHLKPIDHFMINTDQYCQTVCNMIDQLPEHKETVFEIMGGELFAKNINKQLEQFYDSIVNHSARPVHLLVYSNLLNNPEVLMDNIDYLASLGVEFEINTSYDFGPVRYKNKKAFDKYITNARIVNEHLNKYNKSLSTNTMRTTYMLQSLTTHDEQYDFFKWLSVNTTVDLVELDGSFGYSLSRDQSVELWKLLNQEFPDIEGVKMAFRGSKKSCQHTRRYAMIGLDVFEGCEATRFGPINTPSEFKPKRINKRMIAYGCYTCKYLPKCHLTCSLNPQYDRCDIKEVKDTLKL